MTALHCRILQLCALRPRLADLSGFAAFATLAISTVMYVPGPGVFMWPTLAYELFMAATFLMRDRPKLVVPTMAGRVVAYSGTFVLVLFIYAARFWQPQWITPTHNPAGLLTGLVFWVAGWFISIGSLWWLRHSFSIEAEARRLVRSGPYGVVRHPIYAGYVIHYMGFWLLYPSLPFALVLLSWLALTRARMHFEDGVLSAAFVEYAEYRKTVGALWPRGHGVTPGRTAVRPRPAPPAPEILKPTPG